MQFMLGQHLREQGAADLVFRIETPQLAQQIARLFQFAQAQVQISQALEGEQVEAYGRVIAGASSPTARACSNWWP
jgi:hypothetical protein